MMIEHRLVFKCDECGKEWTGVLQEGLRVGIVLETRLMPPDWSVVNGRLICDEHQVIIKAEENS